MREVRSVILNYELWGIQILHDVLNRVSFGSLMKAVLRLVSGGPVSFNQACTPASFSFLLIYDRANTVSLAQQAAPASLAQLFLRIIDRYTIQAKDPSAVMIVNHDKNSPTSAQFNILL